jgi:hypothetical protein
VLVPCKKTVSWVSSLQRTRSRYHVWSRSSISLSGHSVFEKLGETNPIAVSLFLDVDLATGAWDSGAIEKFDICSLSGSHELLDESPDIGPSIFLLGAVPVI